MAEEQVLTATEWDYAMLNDRNKLNLEQATLYNLVKIRQSLTFLVTVTAVWVALAVVGIIVAVVESN